MYREDTKHDLRHFNITLHQGGAGDLIGQLPAIKYVLDNHSHNFYHIWIHDYGVEICKELFKGYKNITIRGMSESNKKYKDNLPARSPYGHKIQNLSMHITDHAFITIVGRDVEIEHKNYLVLPPVDISSFKLPEKYICITTGFTSKSREWRAESVNAVVDYIIAKGYTPVFLGKSYTQAYKDKGITGNFKADYTKGINLIDKTTMFEATSIMGKSACVIGLDNGLLHAAALNPETKIVYGFSTVVPEHRLPYRNNVKGYNCFVVKPDLDCFGCQSKMTFAPPEHSFTKCIYDVDAYKCLDLLSSNKWIEQIDIALAPKTPHEKAEAAYKEILQTQEINRRIKELMNDEGIKSGAALKLENEDSFITTAGRMQMIQELTDTNEYDEEGNVIGTKEPIVTVEEAKELLGELLK